MPKLINAQSENDIQIYIATQSHRAGLLFHADGNGNFVHGSIAAKKKLLGSRAGWPDLVYVLPNRLVWIELKTIKGRLSPVQIEVHERLRSLGQTVHTVYARDGLDGWMQIKQILGLG